MNISVFNLQNLISYSTLAENTLLLEACFDFDYGSPNAERIALWAKFN